jgi:cytochrome c553
MRRRLGAYLLVGALLAWPARAAYAKAEPVAGPARPAAAPTPQQLEFFESKVRPVLVQHCYQCHSAKAEKLKGGLRVDGRAALLTGGDSGPAVVPGDAAKSRLVESIRYADEESAMPPKGKLPDAAIKDLEAWVAMGAPWPAEATAGGVDSGGAVAKKGPDYAKLKGEHWAYQPIKPVDPPDVADAAWPRTGVDRFVLAALESRHLKPVADAGRATLVRRLYFDLVGLPPTPAEVEAYANDPAPDVEATAALVDRLLASPRFGERWGRHWLDVARYAESLTLRGFVLKDAWKYRDYVIATFNDDRPFDQFLREQVSGDLMPAETAEQRRRQLTGTTFLALGNNNLEEQDKKQLRMDVVDEQLDTIGKAMLAQTVGCARCHDHKFDPIPTADYYALAGILRNAKTLEHANVSKWMEVPEPADPATEAELRKHEAAVAELAAKLKHAQAVLAKAAKAADQATGSDTAVTSGKAIRPADLPGVVVDDEQARKVGEWSHSTYSGRFVGAGAVFDGPGGKGEKTITFQPDLPAAGRYEVRFSYVPAKGRDPRVPVTVFSADGEKVVEVNEQEVPPIDDRFVSLGTYAFEKNGAGFVLVSNEGTKGVVSADAVQFLPVDSDAGVAKRPATATDGAPRDNPSTASLPLRDVPAGAGTVGATGTPSPTTDLAGQVKKLQAELKKLEATGPKRETVLSVLEEPKIEDARVHIRGSVSNLGPAVPRGFLSCVRVADAPSLPADQSGRLQLGRWLAARDNPLPARVMANRVWHWLVGQGIVRTVDNFGTTGEGPSHPELLDYLATRFADQGWSVKKLVREIVLSRTYALASAVDARSPAVAAAAAADPENRLCWRANRERLDADALLDALLAVAGRLDLTPGGQTFKAGLTSDYAYKHADARRSVYVAAFRNVMNEALEAFDAADPSTVTGRRNASTVAPQALFLLNHPFVQEQATAAAARLMADGPTDAAARAEVAYRWTLGRPPTAAERRVVLGYVNAADGAAAGLTGNDAERAAWAQVFHALFASIDFRYVE